MANMLPETCYDANTGETTYPRAEDIATNIGLPVKACPVTKCLYGYTRHVLDTPQAHRDLYSKGITKREHREAVMGILEDRVAHLNSWGA